MKKVKLVSILLAVVMMFSLIAGCSSDSGNGSSSTPSSSTGSSTGGEPSGDPQHEALTWKISHSRAQGSRNDLTVDELIQRISDATDGLFTLEKYPDNSLGDYETVQERVSIGDVEMMLASAGMAVSRGLQLAALPYMISTWDQGLALIANDGTGAVYNAMEAAFAKIDIKLLGENPMYFGSVTLCKDLGDKYKDPTSNKGMKVRVPSSNMWQVMGDTFGFTSTPMAAADAFTAMQTGIVEGMIGGGMEAYWSNYRDVTKFLLPINTHFECHYLTVSQIKYDELPADWQELLISEGKWLQETAIEKALEEEDLYAEKFTENGVKIYEVYDELIGQYADIYRTAYWDRFPDDLQDEEAAATFQQIRSDLGL